MSAKKLAIYIFIIFMMAGIAFMLYQNKRLATNPLIPAGTAGIDLSPGVNNNQRGGLDLNIFFSDKFKNLRANMLIIKEPPEVGKRNPFKPN